MTCKEEALPPSEAKATYVRSMFGRIAGRYDLMNRLMTLGRDQAWRRHAVTEVAVPAEGRVLDVASGTGDLAFEVLRQHPDAQVVGLDFTPEMLALAQKKADRFLSAQIVDTAAQPQGRLQAVKERRQADDEDLRTSHLQLHAKLLFVAGDATRLPFPDGAFDSVVTGFAMRNVSDIPATFAEAARVTCPGGRVACLEIAKPRSAFFHGLFALYFYRLVPLLGGWITGQRSAYTYLPHSLTGFLTPDEIVGVMRRTGWREVSYRRMMLGTVAVHTGVRGQSDTGAVG